MRNNYPKLRFKLGNVERRVGEYFPTFHILAKKYVERNFGQFIILFTPGPLPFVGAQASHRCKNLLQLCVNLLTPSGSRPNVHFEPCLEDFMPYARSDFMHPCPFSERYQRRLANRSGLPPLSDRSTAFSSGMPMPSLLRLSTSSAFSLPMAFGDSTLSTSSEPCLLGGPDLPMVLGDSDLFTESEPCLRGGSGLPMAAEPCLPGGRDLLMVPGGSALSTSSGPRLLGGFPGGFNLTPAHDTFVEDSISSCLKAKPAIKPPFPDIDF